MGLPPDLLSAGGDLWGGHSQTGYNVLTPLIYTHVTPYGTFRLDMSERLDIDEVRHDFFTYG
jgi:hypothetical protein